MWIVFIGIKLVSRVIETEKKIVHPMLIWMSVNLFFSVWKKKFNSNRLVFQHLVFLYRQFWHKCEIKEHSYRSPHAHVNRSRESQPHIQFSLPIAYASCSPLNTPFSLRARARSLYALTIYIYRNRTVNFFGHDTQRRTDASNNNTCQSIYNTEHCTFAHPE